MTHFTGYKKNQKIPKNSKIPKKDDTELINYFNLPLIKENNSTGFIIFNDIEEKINENEISNNSHFSLENFQNFVSKKMFESVKITSNKGYVLYFNS